MEQFTWFRLSAYVERGSTGQLSRNNPRNIYKGPAPIELRDPPRRTSHGRTQLGTLSGHRGGHATATDRRPNKL